jgi:hypothetical protein
MNLEVGSGSSIAHPAGKSLSKDSERPEPQEIWKGWYIDKSNCLESSKP